MAMKYKGQKEVTALMCGIALLCIIFPIVLAIAIPAAVVGIVCAIVDAKKKKREQQWYNEMVAYLTSLDMMSKEEFESNVGELINKVTSSGYNLNRYVRNEMSVKYYQSVDNIGIGIVRRDYGNEFVRNSMIVTNRELTPKAREFCRNGMIVVVSRNVIADMYMFKLRNEG